jgi:hypothetical protein
MNRIMNINHYFHKSIEHRQAVRNNSFEGQVRTDFPNALEANQCGSIFIAVYL